jgi:hypothetical protein
MALVHEDEAKQEWVLQTRDLSGRWDRDVADTPRSTLLELLLWHVDDGCDPDFIVPVRFRHVETGDVVDPSWAYDKIEEIAKNSKEAHIIDIQIGRGERIRRAVEKTLAAQAVKHGWR